jgi:hypothetical protein
LPGGLQPSSRLSIIHIGAIQTIDDLRSGTMHVLASDVLKHPQQIALAETDDTLSALPTQRSRTQRLIGVMPAASLEVFHHFADGDLPSPRSR